MTYLEDIKQKTINAKQKEDIEDKEFFDNLIIAIKESIDSEAEEGTSNLTYPLLVDIDTAKRVRDYFIELGFDSDFEVGDKAYNLVLGWK